MRKLLIGLILLSGIAAAQPAVTAKEFQWPKSHTRVVINGQEIDVEWRDGQPWAAGTDVAKATRTKQPDHSVNLAEVLADAGYQLQTEKDGSIKARDPKNTAFKGGKSWEEMTPEERRRSSAANEDNWRYVRQRQSSDARAGKRATQKPVNRTFEAGKVTDGDGNVAPGSSRDNPGPAFQPGQIICQNDALGPSRKEVDQLSIRPRSA